MNSPDPDFTLLLWGFGRSGLWLFGAVMFAGLLPRRFTPPDLAGRRHIVLAAGFALASLTAFVFAFRNAGYLTPEWSLELSHWLATPITGLIVAGAALAVGNVAFRGSGRLAKWHY